MSTGIEWTDATWNPVTGCSHVSEGCRFCYAERISRRRGWTTRPWSWPNAEFNVALHPERLKQPFHWRKPRMVFVNSMSDLFHEHVPFDFIAQVFDVMADARCQQHTFQVLTKRPQRALQFFDWLGDHWPGDTAAQVSLEVHGYVPNVWLGESVENQQTFDSRVAWLALDFPTPVKFLSCEPLLGPILLGDWVRLLQWVIVGGESGPDPRPTKPDWVREIRDQCVEATVPFFFKQWGGRHAKAGGRELDGREWNEMPQTVKVGA